MVKKNLIKVISGGQTGVDQAALHAAVQVGLEIGGWCPPDRESEGEKIADYLPLRETPQERSQSAPEIPRSQRTEWNVRDSNGTLILKPVVANNINQDSGSDWTKVAAIHYQRPLLICNPNDKGAEAQIINWIRTNKIMILNVGGPSEKIVPGIGNIVYQLLLNVFHKIKVT